MKLIQLGSINCIFVILLCGCSPKINTEEGINIIIENNLEYDVYIGRISWSTISHGDSEKIYYLSIPNHYSPYEVSFDGDFNFVTVVESKSTYTKKIKTFEINNERIEYVIDEHGSFSTVLKDDPYESGQVFFKIYYFLEETAIRHYAEYVSTTKEKGYSVKGQYLDGEIIFVIW